MKSISNHTWFCWWKQIVVDNLWICPINWYIYNCFVSHFLSILIVYHQYSVPTVLRVVAPISFLNKVILYRLRMKDCQIHSFTLPIFPTYSFPLRYVERITLYELKELLLFYHQFAQYRHELFYLAALHFIIIEVYIIEEAISLVFGHITTITASNDCYGG